MVSRKKCTPPCVENLLFAFLCLNLLTNLTEFDEAMYVHND